jgi:thioredoxin 1
LSYQPAVQRKNDYKQKEQSSMFFKKEKPAIEADTEGILYFYLSGCPYCRMADKYIAELIEENPEFAGIKITKVEERENAALARTYDYHLVPCLWAGNKKLHEGVPTKAQIKACLTAAL